MSHNGLRTIEEEKEGIDGKVKHIGSYLNEIEAAKAYDRMAIKHFGEFAKLNFEKVLC
ncbi:putative homing endonuclease [Yersinia phage JC221]|nr:putative homing endonuclease [Yersinia phage JC221]